MNRHPTIGIIGGAGWLGQAFAGAIVDAGISTVDTLTLSYRSSRPEFLPQARWTRDNQQLADCSDIIIVSVRPEDFPAIEISTTGKLVISVMAGVTLDRLAARFRTDRVVRALPNGAAEVRKSYTPWIATQGTSAADRAMVQALLAACGSADEVSNEADIDYFTGLTGSGPAFPALLAAAMMKDAISHGISPDIARRSVNAVLVGTGRLLERRDECPDAVVQTFMDYRGTTAEALTTMRAAGFETAVRDGLEAAYRKSVSMGQSA